MRRLPYRILKMALWKCTAQRRTSWRIEVFVARVLGISMSRVNMRVRRMGGAYGGKESRSTPIAMYMAVAARKDSRPVRMMLNRDEDIAISGQRHPFQARWKVGVDSKGKIQVLDMDMYNNAGHSLDMSGSGHVKKTQRMLV